MANKEYLENMAKKIKLLLEEKGNDVVEVRVSSKNRAEEIEASFQAGYAARVIGPSFSDDEFSGGRIEYIIHVSRGR